MKNLIKVVGLIAVGTVSAGDSTHLKGKEILHVEVNTPAGLSVTNEGNVLNNSTKAMLDHERPVGGTSIRYYSSAASAMNLVGSSNYTYVSPGCREGTTGMTEMDEALDIPRGSKIVSFSAYGIDNDASSRAVAYIYQTDITTGTLSTNVSYTSGNTETPNRFNIGGFLDYTKEYHDNLWVRLWGTSNAITLCGFRIGYVPPNVADDVIFVHNFYR
ncbi:MAG: hypothetical protein DWP95_12940 [Proteobacteria bacterium]|nr:MAG: hypothetical protein DWP95_12940 [Pseudomonadota bacterium]